MPVHFLPHAPHLDAICTRKVGLEDLPGVFPGMLAGGSFGRTLVEL